MKKNRTLRIAVLMLALTLLTCCFVGSTFAKYTSSATGTANAVVANWEINVGPEGEEVNITGADTIEFALFDTIVDTVDGATDTEVRASTEDTKYIAPGTKGAFDIEVANASDVDAQFTISFTEENLPTNIQFRVKNGDGEYTAWNSSLAALSVEATEIAMDTDTVIIVEWQWVFETDADSDPSNGISGDAADTTDGIANETVTITATINVDQID